MRSVVLTSIQQGVGQRRGGDCWHEEKEGWRASLGERREVQGVLLYGKILK